MQHLGGAYSRNLQVLFRRGRDSTKCQIEAGLAGAGGVTQDGLGTYSHLMDVLGRTVGDPGMTGFVGEQPAVVMKNGGKKR